MGLRSIAEFMDKLEPSVSIVIVTWNSGRTIAETLTSLLQQSKRAAEIIVVDNGSTDSTLDLLRSFGNEITLLTLPRNTGYCHANNLGIVVSCGTYVLFSNPDVVYDTNFVLHACEYLQAHPKVGVVGGKLVRPREEPPSKIDSAGICMRRNFRAADRGAGEPDNGQYDAAVPVLSVCTAAAVYRRSCLQKISYSDSEYFDELFFAYKEDIDLGWRAINHGWEVHYNPACLAYHHRGWKEGTPRKTVQKLTRYHSFKNRYILLIKNLNLLDLRSNALRLIAFELLAAFYVILREPFLLKGYVFVLRNLQRICSRRHALARLPKTSLI
jgi:GT2 family glycosyltransferase